MTNIIPIKRAPTEQRSRSDTLVITQAVLKSWKSPPFQRPLRENEKVRALIEELKVNGGVLPGVITLGQLSKDRATYIIDGQHRLHAFEVSELREIYADVRIIDFDSVDEMGEEFVKLNSSLVRMRPDDVLRGLEASHKTLQLIRHLCPFVGYDQIRRNNTNSPVVGMSATLRCWAASLRETPSASTETAFAMASQITVEEARHLADFLNIALRAWGREYENSRLWGGLNLTLCMWLYRRLVLSPEEKRGQKRFARISANQFEKCLLGLAGTAQYVDWLWGRQLGERDRAPCYRRIREAFTSRMNADGLRNTKLPGPPWAIGRNA